MWEVIVPIVLLAGVIALVIVMIRGLAQMWSGEEGSGSISGGVVDAISEVDRIVRPAIENVIEEKRRVKKHEDNVGGE